jgi:hypothetical protein
LAEHHRKKSTVEADSGEQIQVERTTPFSIIQNRKPAGRSGRSAYNMDDDVDAAEPIAYGIDDRRTTRDSRYVSRNEVIVVEVCAARARRDENCCPGLA